MGVGIQLYNTVINAYIVLLQSKIIYYIVGRDYTTLTGEENITAVFTTGSISTSVKILIYHDRDDEDEEYFTANLELNSGSTSAKIFIRDTITVLCSFNESQYDVYESLGNINLTVTSDKAIPFLNYSVQVDTIFYEIGNATG